MVDTKISELPAAAAAVGSMQLEANNAGASERVTITQTETLLNANTATLTNKTINLASNTFTGTTAQFNTALSDGTFVTTVGTPADDQIGIFTGDGTLEGDADLTWDGTNLFISNGSDGISINFGGIVHKLNTDLLFLGGGNASTTGGNILMYGGAHATKPGDLEFRSGAQVLFHWDESDSRYNVIDSTAQVDFSGAASLEIPNGAAPTVDAAGEIAIDTTITDYTGMMKYHDGTEELTVLAVPTANLSTVDGQVPAYNAANNELEFVNQTGGSGEPSDGDKGDITVSGSGLTWTIDTDAVTYAKIQDVSQTNVILGRDSAGAGIIEEIAPAAARTLLDVDQAGTDNSTNVTLAGTPDYITISGQEITRNQIDLTADVTGLLPSGNIVDEFLANNGGVGTGVYDFGGATSLEIPNSAAPTVDADGEIAIDTTVTDFSHGILKFFSGEEVAVVAVPVGELTTPTDGDVPTYVATADEFQLAQPPGSGGGEANTASNLGAGVGVFETKSGTDLQFRSIVGQTGIDVTEDVANDEIDIAIDSTVATLTGTQTLTNKTLALGSNTISGTTAQFNVALTDGSFATLAGTETLTNKTIALGSNTVSGTTAQFNTALSDGSFATLSGTETLTNKTLDDAKFDIAINTQTGTAYTLVLADSSKIVEMNNAAANTLTIPTNASVAFAIGTMITVTQLGAGATTVDGDTGVTVNGVSGGGGAIDAQYDGVSLYKRGTDEWIVQGAIGAIA